MSTSVEVGEWGALREVPPQMKFDTWLMGHVYSCDLCCGRAVNYYATPDGRGIVVCHGHESEIQKAQKFFKAYSGGGR